VLPWASELFIHIQRDVPNEMPSCYVMLVAYEQMFSQRIVP
jgi:hypothetical protein